MKYDKDKLQSVYRSLLQEQESKKFIRNKKTGALLRVRKVDNGLDFKNKREYNRKYHGKI
jgi:hypothetical protein